MVQVEEEEGTIQLEEEVEAGSTMVEVSSNSLLKIFPLRISLLKIPLKVLGMKDHYVKFVGSLDIKLWIAITG